MNTLDEERYVFFLFSAGDLQECKKTLSLLCEATNDLMCSVIIKSAIISYARPFSGNESKFRTSGKWKLDEKDIPQKYVDVHTKAIEYRNKLIAHTDLPYKNPELLKAAVGYVIGHSGPGHRDFMKFSEPLLETCTAVLDQLWEEIYAYRDSL